MSASSSSSAVYAWGSSLAIGSDSNAPLYKPTRLETGSRPLQTLGVAAEQAFVVTSSGAVWAAGLNNGKCLFEDKSEATQSMARVDMSELEGRRVEAIDGGKEHFVAVLDGGDVLLSWGSSNEFGQAGQGSTSLSKLRPRAVVLPGPRVQVRQVACGELHSLFLTVAGTLYSCGDGTKGALGLGNKESVAQPTLVNCNDAMAMPLRAVSAGAFHNLALTVGGAVLSWGFNKHGRLGLGSESSNGICSPQLVESVEEKGLVVAAGGQHSAIILSNGRCVLAGDNAHGQLGHPTKELLRSLHFTDIPGEWRTVALGTNHTLLLSREGQVMSCGRNDEGQLGSGTNQAASPSLQQVQFNMPLGHYVAGIACGPAHSVALLQSSTPASAQEANSAGDMGRACFSMTLPSPADNMLTDEGDDEQPIKRTKAVRAGDRPLVQHRGDDPIVEDLDELPRTLSGRCMSMLSQAGQPELAGAGLAMPSSMSVNFPHGLGVLKPVTVSTIAARGVCSAAKFAGMDVDTLKHLADSAVNSADGAAELQRCLVAIFAVPALLNTSFCFPGSRRLRVDAEGLQAAMKRAWSADVVTDIFRASIRKAMQNGLMLWGLAEAASQDSPPPLSHRDQVRGLGVLLHCPMLAESETSDRDFKLMGMVVDLIAALPRSGRRAFIDVIVEDMATSLRSVLVPCVRTFCDAAVRRAAKSQWRSLEHVWSSLLVLDLLASANQAIQSRLQAELPGDLPQRTLLEKSASKFFQRAVSFKSEGRRTGGVASEASSIAAGLWAPEPPVPASDFHLESLSDDVVPPEVELRLFDSNAKGHIASPDDIVLLRPQDERLHSFIVHRRLVPASFLRRVLQMENRVRHGLQQQQGVNQAIAAVMTGQARAGPGGVIQINPNEVFLILQIRRTHLVEDTLTRLQDAPPEALKRQLKVQFVGEEGQDAGGVSREFFRLIGEKLFTVDSQLFNKGIAEDARVLWFDGSSPRDHVDFWLVGVILGLAVYNNLPGLDARLPVCLFKKLNGEQLNLEDLREVHPSVAGSLRELLSWQPPPGMDAGSAAELFENTFCLDFTVTYQESGRTVVHELRESGESISVTMQNRHEFVTAYCKWALEESISKQFEAFKKGFSRVCSSDVFKALTGHQLAQIVLGESDINLEHLRPKAKYEGFDAKSPYIEQFWDVLKGLDAMQKRKFLAFVTGSDRAPVGGLAELTLMVQRAGSDCGRLPSAHTCFNLLVLPEYSSRDRLENFLLTAIENAEGFGLQ